MSVKDSRHEPIESQSGRHRDESFQTFKEHVARFIGGTLLLSGALTAAANLSQNYESPLHVSYGQQPARTVSRFIPSQVVAEPAQLAPVTVEEPTVRVAIPAAYTGTFHAAPLSNAAEHSVDTYVTSLQKTLATDPTATVVIDVTGTASDEDVSRSVQGSANIGLPSAGNEQLAVERGKVLANSLRQKLGKMGRIALRAAQGSERIMEPAEQAQLDAVSKHHGLSRESLIQGYNAGKKLGLTIAESALMKHLFADNRSATIDTTVTTHHAPVVDPCDTVVHYTRTDATFVDEHVPADPGHEVELVILPWFIPRWPRIRNPKRFGRRALLAAIPLVAASVPIIPTSQTTPGEPTPAKVSACAVEHTKPGERTERYLSSLVAMAKGLIEGSASWDKQYHLSTTVTPDVVTNTHRRYVEYQVDQDGTIIHTRHVPAGTTVRTQPPTFS